MASIRHYCRKSFGQFLNRGNNIQETKSFVSDIDTGIVVAVVMCLTNRANPLGIQESEILVYLVTIQPALAA